MYILLSNFERIRKSALFFKATFLSSASDAMILKLTNLTKQEFVEKICYYLQKLSLLNFFI